MQYATKSTSNDPWYTRASIVLTEETVDVATINLAAYVSETGATVNDVSETDAAQGDVFEAEAMHND
jgi:hypothetical protein